MWRTIYWEDGACVMIDQRKLPRQVKYNRYRSLPRVIEAIRNMVIRGAPAIGCAAAYGMYLGARSIRTSDLDAFRRRFDEKCGQMNAARPTAVNLAWAVDRMRALAHDDQWTSVADLKDALLNEAHTITAEDEAICRQLGKNGAALLRDGSRVLTHCNTGALATAGYGTALGVIRAAVEAGKRIEVLADETRPFLQGLRLTAWELMADSIPVTVITDSMAGALMARERIDAVVVGADRIAANGDVANKIGTYSVAVLARYHKIPLYVAAPMSTVDFRTPNGQGIPIEQRDPGEVLGCGGRRLGPDEARALNPAFDVTPHRLVAAIITEQGVARPPYKKSLAAMID
ncbi:MAG: S-methyl-5-thioribose-1-phosphate isomerase [Proteobacteria bacterium]|nr:S-methyl-5-thioribose-1-phosphate isomerase [Pseudomonadota bacterium]